MTPLSDALTAAQKRALQALEKAYVAGAVAEDDVIEKLRACGIDEPVERDYLLASLDVLKEWGSPVPAETNGKRDTAVELMSEKQRDLIKQLCERKNLPLPEDMELMTKADASKVIDAIDTGTYEPTMTKVPF